MILLPSQQRNNRLVTKVPVAAQGTPNVEGGMEESYETFEEELGPPRANPPPQKPVRQISRPEMYATRKIGEKMVPAPQEARVESKTSPKEPTLQTTASLHKTLSIQNLTQMETPWENVTLNRCLFVAITILVLTSGFQKLHETLRGQWTGEEEEEVGLRVRRSGTLGHRGKPPELETSLWEVMFWWLPDLDDDDDDDYDEDDGDRQVKRGRSMKRATARGSRGLRNKPVLDKNIMKQKERKLKDRRTKKARDEETKSKKGREKKKELEEAEDDKEENEEDENEIEADEVLNKSKKLEKEKKKTQKG